MGVKWKKNVTRQTTLFPAVGVTRSFGKMSKIFGLPFDYSHILFVDNTWFYPEAEYEKWSNLLFDAISKDPIYILATQKEQKKAGERLKEYVRELGNHGYSREELRQRLVEYDQRMVEFYTYWWIAIPAGDILEEKVKEALQQEQAKVSFNDLMFVREELELVKEKRERAEIGERCQDIKVYDELPRELQYSLEVHARKFGWISTSYHIGNPLTARDFFEKITHEDSVNILREIKAQKERQKNVLNKLQSLSARSQLLIEAMQAVMYLRNYQKEIVNECQHASEKFLNKVAEKLGVPLSIMDDFPVEEIVEFLEQGLSSQDILSKKRLSAMHDRVIEFLDGDVSTVEDPAKVEAYRQVVHLVNSFQSNKDIEGSPACNGRAEGVVRVVRNREEINDFKDGEILVTVMTSIDYVHIMKKAAAIVTDEGGITCHAAIFSRELGVPCIIGTNNATSRLQTGDTAIVDATRGRVIIK